MLQGTAVLKWSKLTKERGSDWRGDGEHMHRMHGMHHVRFNFLVSYAGRSWAN